MVDRWSRALVALAPLLVSGCADDAASTAPEAEDSTTSYITNGDLDDGSDMATVAILEKGDVYCTGVLVDRYVVATAAHCVKDGNPEQVYFGTDPKKKSDDGTFIDVIDAEAHPKFVKKTLTNDVAVLALAKRAPVKPVPILEDGDLGDDDWVGTEIRLVGFGLTKSNGTAGKKRVGTTTIDDVDEKTFHFTAEPSQTCQGDSGGPAFATIGGTKTLVGITSFGDADCEKYGRDTRVDVQAKFIKSFNQEYALKATQGTVPNSGCSAAPGRPTTFEDATRIFGSVLVGLALLRRRKSEVQRAVEPDGG